MKATATSANGLARPGDEREEAAEVRRARPGSHRRQWARTLPLVVACADVAAVALALVLAARFSHGFPPAVVRVGDQVVASGLAGLGAMVAWPLTLAAHGAYAPSVVGTVPEEPRRVLKASVAFFALIAVVDLVWTTNLSSGRALVIVIAVTLLTLAVRVVGERVVRQAREHRRWMRRAVVYGSASEATALASLMAGAPQLGVDVVGTCTTDAGTEGGDTGRASGTGERAPGANDDAGTPSGHGQRALGAGGNADEPVVRALSSTGADMLAVTAGTPSDRLRALAWALEDTGVELVVAPAVTEVARYPVALDPVGRLPLLRVEGCRLAGAQLLAKDALDRIGAVLLLALLSPLMLAVTLAVKFSSPGPVLYRQVRVGQSGRTFTFLKFRTMRCNADAELAQLAAGNESDGLLFKIHDDPRVTKVGRVLRRTSIDELPQLWNVVRGDMSLVGPRPLPVSPDDFQGDACRRLRVKPGITGLWQVSGRSDLSWEDTVRLDMDYVDRWSLLLDLKILLRTPTAVLRARGAY